MQGGSEVHILLLVSVRSNDKGHKNRVTPSKGTIAEHMRKMGQTGIPHSGVSYDKTYPVKSRLQMCCCKLQRSSVGALSIWQMVQKT